jgi:hypothetical protein
LLGFRLHRFRQGIDGLPSPGKVNMASAGTADVAAIYVADFIHISMVVPRLEAL